jgi:hypothetical protein
VIYIEQGFGVLLYLLDGAFEIESMIPVLG